jgi:hypothetical protein
MFESEEEAWAQKIPAASAPSTMAVRWLVFLPRALAGARHETLAQIIDNKDGITLLIFLLGLIRSDAFMAIEAWPG